jgi:benzoate/toluate 1,2-dioxygenase reductase subunit
MSFKVALNFEDGVTRVIECNDGETVLDAAYRHQVKLPMDCSDGVCGTCKGSCKQGTYELGDEYIDEALTDDEAADGLILTCQMQPQSDVVISIPASSSLCASGPQSITSTITSVNALSDTTIELNVALSAPLDFLPGQYINLGLPNSDETRAYSFSSCPGSKDASFLIRNVPNGLMSTYLSKDASAGDVLPVTGPLGSFYLRAVERPVLMLAGGTGLAPILSMLASLVQAPTSQPVYLLYGVTNVDDLVKLEALQEYAEALDNFSYATVVVNPDSAHEKLGFVTDHMESVPFALADADAYLCGPPPMVDAVRQYFKDAGTNPFSFHYEKFNPSQPKEEAA